MMFLSYMIYYFCKSSFNNEDLILGNFFEERVNMIGK